MKGPFQRLAGIFTDEDAGDARITLLFGLAAIAFVLTHVVQVLTYTLPSGQFKVVHVGGAAALIFSIPPRTRKARSRRLPTCCLRPSPRRPSSTSSPNTRR
ncbi:hypothetical protein [Fodinicurvata halophila]|uniref:hypothetical protein n=1 Tax=Fodinicurvata halophila TaxID=1419723 RepID=UPI00362BB23E